MIPGLGGSSGEGKGYPLQYSGLENSTDCIVHGVTKSRTRLSDFHFDFDSSVGKESTCNAGDLGLIPGLGRFPEEVKGYQLRYSSLETPHGQRSLVGHKESDMTERLGIAQYTVPNLLQYFLYSILF